MEHHPSFNMISHLQLPPICYTLLSYNKFTKGCVIMEIYDFTVRDIKGNDISLADFRGEVLLIVNTATGCGFTPQYEGLENLYKRYHAKGFEILDFPCNQFGKQAPGT